MARAKIGYAAMLEQFGPSEVARPVRPRRGGRLLRRHGRRPLPAVGARSRAQASFVWKVLTAAGERTHGRPRPGRDLPVVPHAPGDRRAGRGDAGRDVPGPALARPRVGRGAQRARRRRLLARGAGADQPHVRGHRDHRQALHAARTSSTTAGSSRWRRAGCGRCPRSAPPIYVATAGPVTAKRTGQFADGIITVGRARGEDRDGLRASSTRARARPARIRRRCRRSCSSTCRGRRHGRGGGRERGARVAERRHEVPQAGHPLAAATSSRWRSWSGPRTSRAACSSRPTSRCTAARSSGTWTWASTRSTCTTSAATRREWIDAFGREVLPKLTS